MFESNALANKRILVTGGGTGLGKAIAEGFLRLGATVYICGRRGSVLKETVKELGVGTGGDIHYRLVDIRSSDGIEKMVEGIWSEAPLTGLINNAAANFICPTKDLTPRGYEAIRSTVMDGSFYTTLALGRRWIESGLKGSVVSNLVTWVVTGSAYVVPSAMAKGAVDTMTKSLAVEWARYGIRVNAVAPGSFPTEGAEEKLNPMGAFTDSYINSVPMERAGRLDELVNLMAFLQSDGCDYLTGQTIALDGAHHLAAPSTFSFLKDMSEQQWQTARESIKESIDKEKGQRSISCS